MAVKFIPKEEHPKEERTYKVGDTFKFENHAVYMLCSTGSFKEVLLMCLTDGHRWDNSKKVSDPYAITQNELENIFGDFIEKFTPINITITED